MLLAGTDLHLHAVRLALTVVESGARLEHRDDALAGLFALDEGGDVRAHFVLAAADEAARRLIHPDAPRAKELAAALRAPVGPAVRRDSMPRVRLELRIEKLLSAAAVPEADRGCADAVGEYAAGLAAVFVVSTPPGC